MPVHAERVEAPEYGLDWPGPKGSKFAISDQVSRPERLEGTALAQWVTMRPSKRKIRYAVVGVGHIAQVAVLPAFEHASSNSQLVALVSSDAKKRRVLSKRYGLEHTSTYAGLERLIHDAQIDAVYLATPNHTHRELTIRAMAAGAHVLCEKPMAMTVDDCQAMLDASKQYSRKLMIAYRLHFEEATLKAIDAARSGKLGNLRYFSSSFSHQIRRGDIRTKAKDGGGALADLGPYPINAVRNLFGADPISVFAWKAMNVDSRSEDVDEMTTAILRFSDQRLAQITVSQGSADVGGYRVVGTKGDLRVEPAFEYRGTRAHHVTVNAKRRDTTYGPGDQFAPELIAFSECILNDTIPEPSGEEGMADVRVLEAIAQSASSGLPVMLAPHERKRPPPLKQVMHKPPVRKSRLVHTRSPSV